MKVLLVQVDGKMPNLALMKISSLYKAKGVPVGFKTIYPSKVYCSCIFEKNIPKARGIHSMYPDAEFQLGGPGLGVPSFIPSEAEHLRPDYSLYPGMDYSLGYTQRGCVRNCPFCIVPKIEGAFREYASIEEFHDPRHSKIVLFDNNFMASDKWREKLKYIECNGLKVSFCQGLDARLITEEKASGLADVQYYNLNFTRRELYFAWDLMDQSDKVLEGLRKILDAGISKWDLKVYVLVGFNTSHEEDLYRIYKLRELKIDPFVMIYNNRGDDSFVRHLARWVNRYMYRNGGFAEYDRLGPRDREEAKLIEDKL